MKTMRFDELEQVYEAMARGIDAAGPQRDQVFLAKLCLLLAHRLGDLAQFQECSAIAAAETDTLSPG